MKLLTSLFTYLLLCSTAVLGQVNIIASDSAGCAPIQVNFSLGGNIPPNVSNYSWTSNGNPFSGQVSPSRIFTNAGNYTIQVVLTLQNGSTQTVSMAAPVQVFQAPTANFAAQPLLLCKGEPTIFTDLSSPGSSSINRWVWAFGDGTIDSSQHPGKHYSQSGLYSVSLQAIDVNGCIGTEYKSQIIDVRWPEASFTGGPVQACNSPHSPTFQANSTDPGLAHFWNFGNGTTANGASAQATYSNPGAYTVTHIVTDPSGCADTLVAIDYINISTSRATIFASDTAICYTDTVFLSCNAVPGFPITWDLDGMPAGTQDTWFTSPQAGTYTMTLELTGLDGCVTRDTQRILVTRPVPDFSADTLFSCDPPFKVNFTNLTSGTQNMSYLWVFGDGNRDSTTNSSNHYLNKGKYEVKLLATDSLGCRAGRNRPKYIEVGGTTAKFEGTPNNRGCKPLNVLFKPDLPTIGNHLWVFGDGDSSLRPKPRHVYLDTGTYVVSHYFTDYRGCVDSAFGVVEVGDTVRAYFEFNDTTVCVNQPLFFDNLSVGSFRTATWYLGGYAKLTGNNIHFAYGDTGYHYVQLTVDDRGCSDSMRLDSAIHVVFPIAKAHANRIGCDTPHTVTFRDSSIGATRYWWDFGTGNPADTSNLRDPVFTYHNTGTYQVRHFVWNDNTGCIDSTGLTVVVEIFDMKVSASPMTGCAPLTVQFQDSSLGATWWLWDFEALGRDSTPSTTRTFTDPGAYLVKVVTTTGGECVGAKQLLIQVGEPKPFFKVQSRTICIGQAVLFTDSTETPIPLSAWLWDFGDGTQSTAQNPSHTYSRPGQYTVTLTVTDSIGCSGTYVAGGHIYVSTLKAAYQPEHLATCIGNTLHFLDSSSAPTSLSYRWDFGDGNQSFSPGNQQHTFNRNDTFLTKLVVTDSVGCTDSLQIPVVVDAPDVDFNVSQTAVNCPPLLSRFSARLLTAHSIDSWKWDFGDGNGSSVQNPAHQYVFPGTYQVSLIVETQSGCIDTFRLDSTILVGGPAGNFSFGPLEGCQPMTIKGNAQIRGTSSNAIDLDDGTVFSGTSAVDSFSHRYLQPGVYYPVMILDDGMGCRISVTSPDSVVVLPKPDTDFEAIPAEGCEPLLVQFLDKSTTASGLRSWRWSFGDGNTDNQADPSHSYLSSGVYDVMLEVENVHGCRDSLFEPELITVSSDVPPAAPSIRYVTVEADDAILIVWEQYQHRPDDFGNYILSQNDGSGWSEIYRSSLISDTSFITKGLNTNSRSYCYRLLVENFCKTPSDPAASTLHCSILLEASPENDAITLDWSAYRGWPGIKHYRLYRVKDYSLLNRSLIAEVPANSLHYLDTTTFCYEEYQYRVEATAVHEPYISRSNIDDESAAHEYTGEQLHIVRATVVGDDFVQVEWAKPWNRLGDRLVLERKEGGLWMPIWEQAYADNNSIFQDLNTQVDEASWHYRAYVTDSCGDRLAPGREGRSILLSGKNKRKVNLLEWSSYREWEFGVAYYEVLRHNTASQQWETIGRTNANDTTFEDESRALNQELVCYAIRAVEMEGNDTTSLSNELCLTVEPTLFAPTAFSPNDDGHNDLFIIPTTYSSGYKLEIFNRWGNKVFESSKPNEGWDGKYKGVSVPEGVYVWKIYAASQSGEYLADQVGTVTVIR